MKPNTMTAAIPDLLKQVDIECNTLVFAYGDNMCWKVIVAPQIDDRLEYDTYAFSVTCLYTGPGMPYHESTIQFRRDLQHMLAELVVEEGLLLISEVHDMHEPMPVTLIREDPKTDPKDD